MKLYMHPVSNTSRPVRLFIAEAKIPMDEQIVDLFTGEHHKEPYATLNPSKMVPMLEDGDLQLTESSAILKYLADKVNSPAYPKDLKQRAKVHELMDWFNSNFYKDYGYGLLYPQMFPHHKRQNDTAQQACIEWGLERTKGWLKILNDHYLGKGNKYLTGDQITIADYFGGCLVTAGEVPRCDFSKYPNVSRWIDTLKKLPSWASVNEAMYGYQNAVKDMKFVTI
jgi:glutathione S-transferase